MMKVLSGGDCVCSLKNGNRKANGFSMIELMIVVAIIGVLVAIAVSGYSRFVSRTHRSEVLYNLEGIYVAEIAHFSEYREFSDDFSEIKWRQEGAAKYTYSAGGETVGMIVGDNPMPTGLFSGSDSISFTVSAWGNIDSDSTVDALSINDEKEMRVVTDDMTS